MPHCIIEYPIELEQETNIKEIVQLMNKDLVASNLFDIKTIKTRAIPITSYLVGGEKCLFIYITIKLLKGRTPHQKENLGNKVLTTLSKKFNLINEITVEIMDIDPDFYFKKE